MGAFNTISIPHACPSCKQSGGINCQTHIARLYGKGMGGALISRIYHIGESLQWSKNPSRSLTRWLAQLKGKEMIECCYADCHFCGADLFAVIEFKELTPVKVLQVGLERDWPEQYPR